jgi:hypothetical protein
MIENRVYIIQRAELKQIEELPGVLEKRAGCNILRWYISAIKNGEIVVEATLYPEGGCFFSGDPVGTVFPGKSVVVSLIPTGIGCDIGGYAADAAPVTALLASCTDYLITNPNAVNASNFISMDKNVLYCEGYMIDLFCKGLVNLYRPYANKLGLIIEKTGRRELEIVFNIINTVRAVHGVDIEHYVVTGDYIGGHCVQTASGAYVGKIDNPGVLFKACDYLKEKGVNAIAVTSNIKDLPTENYAKHFRGEHPNPVGGAEAVISHLVCGTYKLPCAHAPMINFKDMELGDGIVDARGAGEYLSVSGLACVLIGLSKAPQIESNGIFRNPTADVVNINNLLAVVVPAGALGGIPMFYASRYGIPVIAVKNNRTILDVTKEKLKLGNVIEVENYVEAAGIIQALRRGLSIESLYRPLKTLRF